MSPFNSISEQLMKTNNDRYLSESRRDLRKSINTFIENADSPYLSGNAQLTQTLNSFWCSIRQMLGNTIIIPSEMLPRIVKDHSHVTTLLEEMQKDSNPSFWLTRQFQPLCNFLDGIPVEQQESSLRPLPDLNSLGFRKEIADNIVYRWNEAMNCYKAKAYLATTVMLGGILEGFLLATMQKNPKQANQCRATPCSIDTDQPKPFSEWTLSDMIAVAHECAWIADDTKKFSHLLREYRNLVHPHEQLRLGAIPDEGSCRIFIEVTHKAISDMLKAFPLLQL